MSPTSRRTLVGVFTCFVSFSVLLLLGANPLHPDRRGSGKGRARTTNTKQQYYILLRRIQTEYELKNGARTFYGATKNGNMFRHVVFIVICSMCPKNVCAPPVPKPL